MLIRDGVFHHSITVLAYLFSSSFSRNFSGVDKQFAKTNRRHQQLVQFISLPEQSLNFYQLATTESIKDIIRTFM